MVLVFCFCFCLAFYWEGLINVFLFQNYIEELHWLMEVPSLCSNLSQTARAVYCRIECEEKESRFTAELHQLWKALSANSNKLTCIVHCLQLGIHIFAPARCTTYFPVLKPLWQETNHKTLFSFPFPASEFLYSGFSRLLIPFLLNCAHASRSSWKPQVLCYSYRFLCLPVHVNEISS